MKVLHVITGIDRGGAEGHLVELVRHQPASGMVVAVAYLRGHGYWAETFRKLGVEVHRLGLRYYGDPRPWLRLRQIIARADFDLLHAHLPPAELYARLALLSLNAALPVVITKHNEERFAPGPFQKVLGRWAGRRARHVIAISHAVQRFMTGPSLGLDARKFHTIHYGIDAAPFAAVRPEEIALVRKQWGLADDTLAIGFVGRLVEQKDIGTLLRGFAAFAARCEKARLVIVGIGALEAPLRQLADELGITNRVVWAGFRDDIAAVMGAIDVFALTSIFEGLGLVLLEAMAARRPVVATRVGAIPEVVTEGETGLLVAPREPEALAAAFDRLSDAALRARFGEAGRQRVLQEFTLERMCRSTDELYAQCVRARASSRKEENACAASTVN
jgi:glycosyltransferase involved in cell wall biosynthesis